MLHHCLEAKAESPAGYHGGIVRLAVLAIEKVLPAEIERQSTEQRPADAGAQARDAAVLEPVDAQLTSHQLRVGLGGIGDCARERDAIVVDPVPGAGCCQ